MIEIELPDSPAAYRPRDALVGTIRWSQQKPPERLTLHLYWFTSGVGDRDSQIVETLEWRHLEAAGERYFEIILPRAPYSIRNEFLEIHWMIEAECKPTKESAAVEIVIAPEAQTLELLPEEESTPSLAKRLWNRT